MMKFFFSPLYNLYREEIKNLLSNFKNQGTLIGTEARNIVKFFDVGDMSVNIKSFKPANPVNRMVYKFFRKSKAQRSYEYASLLLQKGIGTPEPIAWLNNYNFSGLTSSYYVCRHLKDTFTLSNVLFNLNFPDREKLIRLYTQIIFRLHENGIEFRDNSAGNVLIEKTGDNFKLYLVDLNRMNFHRSMNAKQRLHNFSRMTTDKEILAIISDEYAALAKIPRIYTFEKVISNADNFHKKQAAKRQLKSVLKFYKALKPARM